MNVASDGATWRLGHRPALDGLRGVAILLVLACHGFSTTSLLRPAGSVGVTVFFTLSGFLITDVLLGGIPFNRFYRNRALRLVPAFVVVLIIFGSIEIAGGLASPLSLLPVVFYSANWAAVMGANNELFRHTWSLAVEEQFYLVWPVMLVAARRWSRGPLVATLALLAGSLACIPLHWRDLQWLNDGTDVRGFGLLVGALLAILARQGISASTWRWMTPACLACLLALSAAWVSVGTVAYRFVPIAVPMLSAGLIWAACSAQSPLLTCGPMRYLGTRSYGLYLWNFPLVLLAQRAGGASLGVSLLGVAMSFGAAELSWRLIEVPFLAMKSRDGGLRDAEARESRSIVGAM